MKKSILLGAMIALSFGFASCNNNNDNNDGPTIPEGTSEVTISEDGTEITEANLKNWVQYSVQVANLLTSDAMSLNNAWATSYKNGEKYADTFMNPGNGKTFRTYADCTRQIINGCADIANEVGTAKIGDPRDLWENGKYTDAVYAVESWYSYHSIDDYSNNILSIRNAVYGSRDGKKAPNSIASYLEKNNSTLYSSLTTKITAAYNAIQSIAAPFRSHIGNSSVLVAQDACASLEKTLSTQLLPIIDQISEEDLKPIIIDYVNNVVLPTYADLVDRNVALNTSIRTLANDYTNNASHATLNKDLENAAKAWMSAREPWETSEAFLFGPVADLGLDPNMDSWPLDADALKNIINSGNFSDLIWEGEFDEDDETIGAAQNVRGFHTLEFLIFKNGQPRTIK